MPPNPTAGARDNMLPAVNRPTISPAEWGLLTAISAMALAAKIHGTDKAVMATGYRMLSRVKPAYMQVILGIMNSASPLKHMNEYVATLPQHILEMQLQKPALPLLDAG